MTKAHVACLLLLGFLAAGTVGCQKKKVELVFNNFTKDTRTVEISQGVPPMFYPIGPVPPSGKLRYLLEIEEKYLPLPCAWRAGDQQQAFTVTERMPGQVWIDIKPSGKPVMRDANTEIREETRKTETKIIKKDVPVIE
jgi:hypothetical protein